MAVPLRIVFKGMDSSDAIGAKIADRAEKLARFHKRIVKCHVVVEASRSGHRSGNLYAVHVDVSLPGGELAVNNTAKGASRDLAHENINLAIRDAFNAIARRLKDQTQRKRGEIKTPRQAKRPKRQSAKRAAPAPDAEE